MFFFAEKDNNEHILQKCTELPRVVMSDFYPVVSERSEKEGFNMDRARRDRPRSRRTIRLGRTVVPHYPRTY